MEASQARHEWHCFPTFISSYLPLDGAEIRHCYRKSWSEVFVIVAWLSKEGNKLQRCVHLSWFTLTPSRCIPKKKFFWTAKEGAVADLKNSKGPFLPEQESGLQKNEDDHCLLHKRSSAVIMPVWDPYRYLALHLMHTKMQTHSNTLFFFLFFFKATVFVFTLALSS